MRFRAVWFLAMGALLCLGAAPALAASPAPQVVLVFTQGAQMPPLFDASQRKGLDLKALRQAADSAAIIKALQKANALGKGNNAVVTVEQLVNAFKAYNIKSIELWVKAAFETSGLLALAVDVKGEGGVKVVLAPQPMP